MPIVTGRIAIAATVLVFQSSAPPDPRCRAGGHGEEILQLFSLDAGHLFGSGDHHQYGQGQIHFPRRRGRGGRERPARSNAPRRRLRGQCVYAYDKIKRALAANGSSLKDAVKMTVYVTDMRNRLDWAKCSARPSPAPPCPRKRSSKPARLSRDDAGDRRHRRCPSVASAWVACTMAGRRPLRLLQLALRKTLDARAKPAHDGNVAGGLGFKPPAASRVRARAVCARSVHRPRASLSALA